MAINNSYNKLIELGDLLAVLRNQETGCAWTRAQDFHSLIALTLQEVYELVDAIERYDVVAIKDELGDLLYHVLFFAELAKESQWFSLNDVAANMLAKQQRRRLNHHDSTSHTAEQVHAIWNQQKLQEKTQSQSSLLDNIPETLTALQKAKSLQQTASLVGFDWQDTAPVFEKLQEEISELRSAIASDANKTAQSSEMGDMLFCCVNLARLLSIDPEMALRQTNRKFINRFQYIEKKLEQQNKDINNTTLAEMEQLWQEAKISGVDSA